MIQGTYSVKSKLLILCLVFSSNFVQSNTEKYQYDDLGRLSSVEDSSSKITNYKYDSAGNRLAVTTGIPGGVIPGATSNLRVISERCYGNNILIWEKASGTVEYYEAWASLNSDFLSPYKLISSTTLQTSINVSTKRYIKVKACNSSGCGSYSNQVIALYFSSCL